MFLKYLEIENWTQQNKDYIAKLDHSRVQVAEKLDGSNRMIYLDPEKPIEIYTRMGFETHDCDWLLPELEKIRQLLMAPEKLALYGEIYGSTINKRIDYKDHAAFKVFAACWIKNDSTRGHQFSLEEIEEMLKAAHTSIQVVYWYWLENFDLNKIEEQLDLQYKSNESKSGMIEGWVVSFTKKNETAYDGFDSIIHSFKYKHKNFKDALRRAQVKVEKTSEEKAALAIVAQLKPIFEFYALNDNRIIDMISKIGLAKDQIKPQMLAAYVIKDAKEDFLKDYQIDESLEKKYVKMVFNLGEKLFKRCVELLK